METMTTPPKAKATQPAVDPGTCQHYAGHRHCSAKATTVVERFKRPFNLCRKHAKAYASR
jgi:hypothetical protein